MGSIADEIRSCFSDSEDDSLQHYGMPRRSGRYPYGSGEDPYQHEDSFLSRVDTLKKKGWTETPENIKKEFGLTTTEYRTQKSLAKDELRCYRVASAKSMKRHGFSNIEIGKKLGLNESTVRSLLDSKSEERMNKARETANFLKEQVDKKKMVDVGSGVEREIGISAEKMNKALDILKAEGYEVYNNRIPQATNPGQLTTQKVLCVPGTQHKEIYNYGDVKSLTDYVSRDNGETFEKFVYPSSLDKKRLLVKYAEDGGIEKDGLIEIRRGCKDLSLGESRYAQVRIMVDDERYLKGMAVYSDDMPDGVDVVFNSNKTREQGYNVALKAKKSDPENPFGSLIKPNGQSYYIDDNGEKKLSPINKRAEEGDWSEWKDSLPSQFLAKQSRPMAKKQLDLAKADKQAEFDSIMEITNPVIRKHFLQKFSDECDSAAVDLKAAALPGQKYHVMIPINSLKENEVYAPNYENGTKLALIRYPHGGTFEIPVLTVNNRNKDARRMLGTDNTDAIGINYKNGNQLSGADFDGDTVMCIPTDDPAGKVKISRRARLEGLVGFEPSDVYPARPGMKVMKNTQTEMGKISNLITDMTLAGADDKELERAVRHSMVVIDAEKHKLDYKQSEIDNNIKELREKYQAHVDKNGKVRYGGASTIISRSSGETTVLKRQGSPYTNIKGEPGYDPTKPEGAKLYKLADNVSYEVTKVNKKTGEKTTKTMYRHQKSTKMAEVDDAMELVSEYKHPMELLYADYANSMKSLANKARLEYANTSKVAYDKNAAKVYESEVKSLNSKLNDALLNTPREREAQRQANATIAVYKENNPDAKTADIKKASQQALTKARVNVNSIARRDREIQITDKEWEAIQAGAISENKLIKILNNANADTLREKATPRSSKTSLSSAQINRAKALASSNYTLAEIAKKLGVSTSTVSNYIKS